MSAELRFLTKDGCGLCDDALAKLRPLSRAARVSLVLVAAADDPTVAERLPVVMLGNGREANAGPLTWPQAVRCVVRARFAKT